MKSGLLPFPLLPILTLLLLVTLPGCATVDQKIALNYSPVERAFGQRNQTVAVIRVDTGPDTRNSRGEWVVGSLNNAHGVHQANLLADKSLADWVTEALVLELKRAGFSVAAGKAPDAGDPLAIRLSNIAVSNNVNKNLFTSETKNELKFSAELLVNGALAKSFTVASRARQTVALNASAEDNEMIMLQVLRDAMQQVMAEVNALLAKK